jgi:hypothetical protein
MEKQSFTTCNGHLFYITPEGCEVDIGRVCECKIGPQGLPGPPGLPCKEVGIVDIKATSNQIEFYMFDKTVITVSGDFAAGKRGETGANGRNGVDGTRILNVDQINDGDLLMSMSDGRQFRFKMPAGPTGPKGETGIGISNIYQTNDQIIISLTDGRSIELNLHAKLINSVDVIDGKLVFSWSNGTTTNIPVIQTMSIISENSFFNHWNLLESFNLTKGKHVISYSVQAHMSASSLIDLHTSVSAKICLHDNNNVCLPGTEVISQMIVTDVFHVIQTLSGFTILSLDEDGQINLMESSGETVKFSNVNIHTISF